MTTITRLKTLTGTELWSCIDSTGHYNVFADARRVLADWCDCEFSEIDFIETEHGDFWTVDAEPVAFFDIEFTPTPKVDRAALESAMGSERFAAAMKNPVFRRSLQRVQ